jgi:two-component system CheB/CheR fusion protein
VGASAGGLDAFRQLLAHVPSDSGLALVLVQHLEATRASLLGDALSRATRMEVAQAALGMRLAPNHVYVIPPGVQMAIEGGALRLSPLEEREHRPHLPIDFFLRSLAAERGPQAVGVILSGSASDGTAGLAAIRARGGITLAQDPRTARFAEMPRSALDAGVVDLCLPLPALGAELARLARHPYLVRSTATTLNPTPGLTQVLALVQAATGVDFGEHRPATVRRRLARRMAVRKVKNVTAYLQVLRREPAEAQALYDDLLVRVPSFFQDEESFDALGTVALPDILRHKPPGAPVRAWVLGCATGEEVYSLAISLLEHLDGCTSPHPVVIFGSDLREKALETARAGLYSEAAVYGLGEERLKRFFVRAERGWRVSAAVRELCVFVRHDVARDPPFSKLDLLLCRNLLVDFGHSLRRRVLAAAHYALGQPGYLLLGHAESASSVPRWFAAAGDGGRLLRRRSGPSALRLPPRATAFPFTRPPARTDDALARTAEGLVLARHGPPGVVVNDRLEEELASVKAQVSALLEEHGHGTDALASANDELVSANEELQGLNEELETAQEELQATNEELTTANDALRGRNQELQLASADVLNLLDAVEIPILMLDRERRIRCFTRRAAASMGLTPGDVGRRVTDVALPVQAPDLEAWIARSMDEAMLVEAEVQDHSGRWHRLQVRPHRGPADLVDGAILSLVDVQELKHEIATTE